MPTSRSSIWASPRWAPGSPTATSSTTSAASAGCRDGQVDGPGASPAAEGRFERRFRRRNEGGSSEGGQSPPPRRSAGYRDASLRGLTMPMDRTHGYYDEARETMSA